MDEDGSATVHDPAARLGRFTDVPDGIERLAGLPAEAATPAATEAGPEPDPGPDDGYGLADESDPPPRWAARPGVTITPRGTPTKAEDEPVRSPGGRRSTYWAVAVLVTFGVVAGVGLATSGDRADRASTTGPGSATTAEEPVEAGTDAGGTEAGDSTATTAAASPTTAAPAPATRPPEVGECAFVDASLPPAQYVQVPCGDPAAAVELTQKVAAPPQPGSGCPAGTDTVAQVSAQAAGAPAAAPLELWCLRNVHPPHPGDPGGGGGDLVVGDCLGLGPNAQSVEVPCDGSGTAPEYEVGWLPDAAGACPAEAIAEINLQVPFPAKFCLRYAR